MEKIKKIFFLLIKFVLFILTPAVVIYKFFIQKPIEYAKLQKEIKKQRKEVEEVLKSNENTNKINKNQCEIIFSL